MQEENRAAFAEGTSPLASPYYGPPQPFEFQAVFEPQGGRYVATRVEVRQRPGFPPLQQAELVQVPLSRLSAYVAEFVVYEGASVRPLLPTWYEAIKDGYEKHLEELGTAYRFLRILEAKPTTVLAEELGVSAPTVRRWLRKAVAAGHLTEEERVR